MATRGLWAWALAMTLLGVGAGEASAGKPPAGKRDRTVKNNGPDLNGTRLDDDPKSLRAIDYLDLGRGLTTRDGKVVKGLTVDGTAIAGRNVPPNLIGATIDGVTTDGRPLRVRIDGAFPAPDPDPRTPANEATGLTAYTVSAQLGAEGSKTWKPEGDFRPVCGGKPTLFIAGRWDYFAGEPGDGKRLSSKKSEITVSCLDAAIGKCVASMGYHPWMTGPMRLSHDWLHQSCVRAVRADYCGNGVSHTIVGMVVNIYDDAGIQKDTVDWKPEAHWTPSGARAVEGFRIEHMPHMPPNATVRGYLERFCPSALSPGTRSLGPGRYDVITEHE